LLLKLEQRGWIVLPPRRQVPSNRMRHKQMPTSQELVWESPLRTDLGTLLPLQISEVSTVAETSPRALFENLLHRHHYLSYCSPVGKNLQYLVSDHQGRPLTCVLFGAAAWQCADRDEYIGWNAARRGQGLHLIANNSRFLIASWVRVPSLASYLLSRIARRLSDSHGRQHCFCQFLVFGCRLRGRDDLRKPALVVVELGAVVLAEAEEAAGIRSNNRKQLLLLLTDCLSLSSS
jgi:hypothetical protein